MLLVFLLKNNITRRFWMVKSKASSLFLFVLQENWKQNQRSRVEVFFFCLESFQLCFVWKRHVLGSIVVSIPVCHAGDRGSIPRRGGQFFKSNFHLGLLKIEEIGAQLQNETPHRYMRARLAQSVEHQTFNLRVAGSSPSSGAGI